MPVAVAPMNAVLGAPSRSFFALITSVHTGVFSSKVNCLFVEVLSGSIERGDPVEILKPDGSGSLVAGRGIRQAPGNVVLDLDEPHPPKSDLSGATVARTPGLLAPPLPSEAPGVDRLLDAVRTARSQGFPADWAKPIKPVAGLAPEQLCTFLGSLPDEAVVLLVQKRVRDAIGHHDNPFAIMGDVERAAMHLAAIGLREDGDRLLLAASAAVQGHKAAAALRAGATVGAIGVLATEKITESALDIGRRVGWAIGIEMGDAFANAFQSNVAVEGEVVETALLEADRAVAVGWCKGCHEVVQFKFGRSGLTGSRQLRCPNDNRKADESFIVVPADAAHLQQALRDLKP